MAQLKFILAFQLFLCLQLFKLNTAKLIHHETIPTADFILLNDQRSIEHRNPFRPNAKLKFTFEGGAFTQLTHNDSSTWHINMHNTTKNVVDIRNLTIPAKKTTHFSWGWWGANLGGNLTAADPEVCFDMAYNNASWFSTFLESDQPYPLNSGKPFPKALPLMTGSYGLNQLGPVVDNIFFNSDGFAIVLTQYYPNFIYRKPNAQLCFTLRSLHQPANQSQYNFLHFDIYAEENIVKMHQNASNYYFLREPIYPKGAIPDERMFNQTIVNFDVVGLNQSGVIEKAKELKLKHAQLVLEHWEAHLGDITFDQTQFPDPKSLISELHRLGFLVKLTINSFVAEASEIYRLHRDFLVHSPTDARQAYLFNWTNTHGGLLDYPGNFRFRNWLTATLKGFQKHLGIDGFRFVGGEVGQFGIAEIVHSDLHHEVHYSNEYTSMFIREAARLGNLTEVDAGYKSQSPAIFHRMRDIEPSWSALRSVLPTALTLSLAGYSFILPPLFKTTPQSEELYLRWLQLSTFFPAMQLTTQWNISDKAANLTTHYLNLHLEHSQTIITIAKNASKSGEPLLKPLWYLAPDDNQTYTIADQFALGDNLIVAPILVQGQVERNVYLPTGVWIDQEGKSYNGPTTVRVLVPIEELAYFKRKVV